MKSRMIQWFAVLIFALFGLSIQAQAEPLVVGRDYTAFQPTLSTDDPAKVEVIEFFSYACPHCSDLNSYVKKWAKKLPSDVDFKRVPVSFNPFYKLMARLYYALEAIGELDRLDDAVFPAIHVKGLQLIDDKSILEWVSAEAQGVDAKKFSDAFNSFGVLSKARRADQLAREAKIQGVPSLMVDGRYLVNFNGIKSHEELLTRTQNVINKRRKECAEKK